MFAKPSSEAMASSLHKIVKPDFKRYQKYSLYMRQSNYFIINEPYPKCKCYFMELDFLADLNKSLIDVFLCFFHSVHEIPAFPITKPLANPLKYNQIFLLMVKNYFLSDLFLPKVIKVSEEIRTAVFQIIGSAIIDYLDYFSLSVQIRTLCEQMKEEMQAKFNKRLHDVLQNTNEERQDNDSLRLDIINNIMKQQKDMAIQSILNIEQPSLKEVYIPKQMKSIERIYLKNIVDTLVSFRFTKKLYRSLKFSNFIQKKYKGFFNLHYAKEYGILNKQKRDRFILKRYTNKENEYLTNLFTLVNMRKDQEKYDQEMFQASKQLLKELISHNNSTKSAYPKLSPFSIIFNQISLKVQLSYENPLLQALGLLHRPTNAENTVCFMATPVPYDTYSNYKELQNPELLTNHLIGINKILKDHYRTPSLNKTSDLAIEKQQVQYESESWRFMLTVHFLMHGKEYYRTAGSQTFRKKEDYKGFVRQQQQKLKSPEHKGYYANILGSNFMKFATHKVHDRQYTSSLYFFENLFRVSEDSDSLIQSIGQIKVNRYMKIILLIIRELLATTQDREYINVYNTIRHLLRFYLGLFLQISQILILCQYSIKNQAIGLLLFEEFSGKLSKEASTKKPYIQISYEKFGDYRRRNNERPEGQFIYLTQHYSDQYDGIQALYSSHSSIKEEISNIFEKKLSERFKIDQESKKEYLILEIRTVILEKLQKIRPIITSIIFKQFITQKQRANPSPKRRYLNCKLELLTLVLLGLTQQNFIVVQSMIIPALKGHENSQSSAASNDKTDRYYIEQYELCEYCLQIMKEQTIPLPSHFQKNDQAGSSKQHRKKQ